ncbi:MAG: hypothetical protein R2940_17015 [Syntrophotaleaceae bacterium]
MEETPPKKHPCPDCRQCQWCPDTRCAMCLRTTGSCRKKMSIAEQIALYEKINREYNEKKSHSDDEK